MLGVAFLAREGIQQLGPRPVGGLIVATRRARDRERQRGDHAAIHGAAPGVAAAPAAIQRRMEQRARSSRGAPGGIDQEWDGYVSQLKNVGAEKMIEVYQQAYDRYKKNS